MVIPGSFGVLVLGLLAAWAEGQPLAETDNWWLLTSLILSSGSACRCRPCSCRTARCSKGRSRTRGCEAADIVVVAIIG